MKSRSESILTILLVCLLLLPVPGRAQAFNAPQCRPLELVEPDYRGPAKFDRGLLWRIGRTGVEPSYVFGTIHVADAEILKLPDEVSEALAASELYVMEIVPDPGQMLAMSSMLFFTDGRSLQEFLCPEIYTRTAEILQDYYIPREAVGLMKPWAAFITMNYPPETGTVLDEVLMNVAMSGGAEIEGLETMQEQLAIFSDLPMDDQITLLTDTVCHHETVLDDIATMKRLYQDRNLKGLYEYSNRYNIQDESVYIDLMDVLLTRRNHRMVDRMQPMLDKGGAFVAVGAMHLPGAEGILNLLENRGYEITRVY